MQFTNDSSRYGSVSQWLHWTTVALVIVLLVMGNAFNIEADEPGSALFFWHSSLGVLVFILAAARIGWFLFSRPPALPQSTSRLFRVLARSTHIALYALLFSLPVSGWLAASSEGSAVPIYRIKLLPGYRPYFEQAFGSGDVVTMDNASKAIAAYERTLITPGSAYDRYVQGDHTALSAQQIRGMDTFAAVGCASCHQGPNFSGPALPIGQGFFMKFPVYPQSPYVAKFDFMKDLGRYEVTHNPADKNVWLVPGLRNLVYTAPYMHNGSVQSLPEAVRVMASAQLNRKLMGQQVGVCRPPHFSWCRLIEG